MKRIIYVLGCVMWLIVISLAGFYAGAHVLKNDLYLLFRNDNNFEVLLDEIQNFDADFTDNFPKKDAFYEICGFINKCLNVREISNIVLLDNGHLVIAKEELDVSEEINAINDFVKFLREQGASFLYVNAPAKMEKDEDLQKIGIDTYSNKNADDFLYGIKQAGIDVVDLREDILEQNLDFYSLFYKTDHHWKVETALWATKVIVGTLNNKYGYNIDLDIYDNTKFKYEFYDKSWLGESGRKYAVSYVGLEDFTLIQPSDQYRIQLSIPNRRIDMTGGFEVLLDMNKLTNKDIYQNSLYYIYLYGNDPIQYICNENAEYGNILILKDSFAQAVIPFLSLGVKNITAVDLRYFNESVKQLICNGKYDTIIMLYNEDQLGKRNNDGTLRLYNFGIY